MPHGTTIYFQHPDESSWREQLAAIESLLSDFGASRSNFYQELNRRYTAEVTGGLVFKEGEADIIHSGELWSSVAFDSVELLEDEKLNQLETSFSRPLGYPADSKAENGPAVPLSRSFQISLVYRPGFCTHEILSRTSSRGVWGMNLEAPLDPYWAQLDVEREKLHTYEEVWDHYELVKRIHCEVGFNLTAGSFIENYYEFGESEGTRPGFDQLFRFDRSGPSRLIQPYEERRPFHLERDANGDNELSIDRETGLYRCVVAAGPVM